LGNKNARWIQAISPDADCGNAAILPGEVLSSRVSISAPDREAGSPKEGDMIARNPANHDDQWLVSAAYFAANFEAIWKCRSAESLTRPIRVSLPSWHGQRTRSNAGQ
jgi:hypothetical protein